MAREIEIVHSSTVQQVADGLTAMILDGRLKPGERLRESVLADNLQLSRNTVREAVRIVQAGGLIRHRPNHGAIVWDPTDSEIMDVYNARYYLETTAAGSISETTSLTEVHAAMEEFRAVLHSGDPFRIVEKDLAIHSAIVGLLGSRKLTAFYQQLVTELRYFMYVLSTVKHEYEDPDALEAEHERIIDALETRDPALAQKVVSDTIIEYRDAIRQIIANRHST
ncbi:DNA-binding GntR family transcriptional regulator [Pseudarthrobacter sp. PvP004]|uniref:GntR family transcriptional regulator n=1 Tax=Pseudarthrobacter sp. PvP004 TaxID=2817850 RepID=UPI001AE4815B|nr:GntR family transcriptional regulator [Pseudarthrobacter sp. PvP004]MBP2267787.1 DNA-binding GntR family transcriptional regulator [Pseudarthrobacter sp. PvP004]